MDEWFASVKVQGDWKTGHGTTGAYAEGVRSQQLGKSTRL